MQVHYVFYGNNFMSIYVKTSNNLEFDSEHDRCRLIISRT